MDATVEHGDEQLEGFEPDAAEALGQHVRAQEHQAPGVGLAERRANPCRVRTYQVELQLSEPVRRDHDVGEVAEARGDAVDDATRADRVVYDAARASDSITGRRRQGHRSPLQGDGLEAGESEAVAVEFEGRARHEGARTIASGAC